MARWAAWPDDAGSPPSASSNSSLPMAWAAVTLWSFASTVMAEAQAIAGTQPLARKRMSAMRSPCNLMLSSSTSPQPGFSTRAEASGFSTSPGLRGF